MCVGELGEIVCVVRDAGGRDSWLVVLWRGWHFKLFVY